MSVETQPPTSAEVDPAAPAGPIVAELPGAMAVPAGQPHASAFNRGRKIGILIVAYNAVTTLTSVLKRIPADVWANVEEVVVFDDHSKDDTYALGLGFKALTGNTKLHVIHNEKNLGYGGNQKLGYQYLMDKGFDVAVLLHGDGQYAPEILADMYAPLVADQCHAVFGSRMMKDFGGPLKGGMPLYKYLGNRVLTIVENAGLGMNLTEFHSGYRAYSLDALRKIDFSKMTNDFHFDTEIIVKLNHQGFRIKEIPIPTYYGNEICRVNGMKYAKDVFRSIARYKKTIRATGCAPEYAEYMPHYPLKETKGSSHYVFRQLVGHGQDVLDVGCGEGFFAEQLAKEGNRVYGIDLLESPKCASSFVKYVQANADQGIGAVVPQLDGQKFDKVLLQDVLEHLTAPEKTLNDVRDTLKPSGLLLVSVPNVANITVRLSLLLGRFEYTQRGILDKTHVRFFTRRTAKRLLKECGYKVTKQTMTVMPFELVLGLAPTNPVMRFINFSTRVITKILPNLFGYQCVFACQRRDSLKPR